MKRKLNRQEIESIVSAYQQGDREAANELIEVYQAYFQKFINILKKGKFEMKDKTQRNFVKLFVAEQDRVNVSKFHESGYIQTVLTNSVFSLKDSLRSIEEDELRSEMVIILLQLADRHDGISFKAYVARIFPLRLFDVVITIANDKYDRLKIALDENMEEIGVEDTYHFTQEQLRYYILDNEPTEYDMNWVNGDCGEPFDDLTSFERKLLKKCYEWKTIGFRDPFIGNRREIPEDVYESLKAHFKKSEEEIAFELGCSRKTINVKKNDIKNRISEYANDLHLIKR